VEVGRQWVRRRAARNQWNCNRQLRELRKHGAIAVEAAWLYIELLGQKKKKWTFRLFLARNRSWLRANARTWGAVGYTMVRLRQYRRLVRWMADWRTRDGLEPWMLANLAEGLRAVGRKPEAVEANRRALALPFESAHANHRLWLAADALQDGQLDAARQWLSQVRRDGLQQHNAFLFDMVTAVLTMAAAPEAKKSEVFADARRAVAQAAAGYRTFFRDRPRLRFYRKCVWMIARYRGGSPAKLWGLWRRYGLFP
jgi:hypothetical protein